MNTLWKVVIGLVLTLPIAAYVAGTLATSTDEPPEQRAPVVIQNGSPSPTTAPDDPAREPARPRPSGMTGTQGDDGGGAGGDDGGDDRADDNGVRVVNPEPTRVDDDDDGREDDEDTDDGGDDD